MKRKYEGSAAFMQSDDKAAFIMRHVSILLMEIGLNIKKVDKFIGDELLRLNNLWEAL